MPEIAAGEAACVKKMDEHVSISGRQVYGSRKGQ
jgi:hypothetical protein